MRPFLFSPAAAFRPVGLVAQEEGVRDHNGAAEENFPRKMPADAWFDFKGCDRSLVEEQSFLLPNDEVLTVLKLPDEAIA